jgi:hypothetical protein
MLLRMLKFSHSEFLREFVWALSGFLKATFGRPCPVPSGGSCNESWVLLTFDSPQPPWLHIVRTLLGLTENKHQNLMASNLLKSGGGAALGPLDEEDLMTRFFLDSQEISLPFDVSSINQILKHVEDFSPFPENRCQASPDRWPSAAGVPRKPVICCAKLKATRSRYSRNCHGNRARFHRAGR